MKTSLILFTTCLPLLLCASCASPDIITQTEVVEVKIPVRCEVEMPKKPTFSKTTEGTRALLEYFVQCEERLRYCIGESP